MSAKKLVIVGDGEFAEIAYEYFTHDSDYDVAGFAVPSEFRKKESLFDLPVHRFEEIETICPPDTHHAFVAVTYTQLNRVRTRLYRAAKEKGYTLANYISSRAFVWRNVVLGDNCFVFEQNVLQYSSQIGNNVILWSGNHVGHRAVIEDNCFVSSHVVISGYCRIGANCFLGVNSTLGDFVTVGADTIIGAGAVVLKNVAERQVMRGNPAVHANVDSFRVFNVKES